MPARVRVGVGAVVSGSGCIEVREGPLLSPPTQTVIPRVVELVMVSELAESFVKPLYCDDQDTST